MTFPAWRIGAQVEYANGIRTQVVHVDGPFAILQEGDAFIVARGDQREFEFVNEAKPHRHTLSGAMDELRRAKPKPKPKKGK